jgi:hypothetical protein
MRRLTRRAIRTFAIAIGVAGVMAATALALTPSKGTYTGSTNQTKAPHHSITVKTNDNGKVVHISIDWRARCQAPNSYWSETTVIQKSGIVNDGGGVFHVDGGHNSNGGGGITGKVTDSLDGHFTDKTHAQGKWQATVKVYNKNGKKIDTCSMHTKWHVGA